MKRLRSPISIIGIGNVGFHLLKCFLQNGVYVSHVVTSSENSVKELDSNISCLKTPEELPENELVFVCVPDDIIIDIVTKIPVSCEIAYTAGSVELNTLPQRPNIGVFYPLQTFSKHTELDLFNTPIFIEANNPDFANKLFQLAQKLSKSVSFANSDERKKLHLAAIWVNNFTNHMNHIAHDYLSKNNLDFQLLLPLLNETVRKLTIKTPFEAQTGPAKRGDTNTINDHIKMLKGPIRNLYKAISHNIQETHSDDKL